ncbi:MAG TPA: hypothetical protein PK624_03185 [Spirochaetota bacterium]|nr:hypothetical protein [Spirochaetota bacterium]HOU84199.1 hypothetical protein [Spirochaetota bacterium]HPK57188.1 hypothetical protein [Spirochaetota bacterium]HQE59550.1 hypothetical protein [Spirochaetota bacterium]
MSIKPIDLLTSMNQLHEVAKTQHQMDNLALSQQLHLDKEADKKSKESDKTVDQTNETYKTVDNDSHAKENRERRKHPQQGEVKNHHEEHAPRQVEDERLGSNFDIRK